MLAFGHFPIPVGNTFASMGYFDLELSNPYHFLVLPGMCSALFSETNLVTAAQSGMHSSQLRWAGIEIFLHASLRMKRGACWKNKARLLARRQDLENREVGPLISSWQYPSFTQMESSSSEIMTNYSRLKVKRNFANQ